MAIPLYVINKVADLFILSISLMQTVTGKTKEEVLKAAAEAEIKTDELIKKLR